MPTRSPELTSRSAVCLWIPDFGLACERGPRRAAPARAAALLSPTDGRRLWVVSQEAEALGVRPGMTLSQGLGLAPSLVVLEPDPVHYAAQSDRLIDVLYTLSPVIEHHSSNGLRIFVGMDGLEALYGTPKEQLDRVWRIIQGALPTVLPVARVHLGWAHGKFVAWVAAVTAGIGKCRIIQPEDTQRFLASRPVRVLPIPTLVVERLERLGFARLGDIAVLRESALVSQFGRLGRRIWRYARGDGPHLVRAKRRCKPLRISLQLSEPVSLQEILGRAVQRLVARTFSHPDRRGRSMRAVRLDARLEQTGSWSTAIVLKEQVPTVTDVVRPLCHRLTTSPPQGAVEELTLTVTALGSRAYQPQLFAKDAHSAARTNRIGSLRAVARELQIRQAKLFRVMEVSPWSRIPERRHALIDFDP